MYTDTDTDTDTTLGTVHVRTRSNTRKRRHSFETDTDTDTDTDTKNMCESTATLAREDTVFYAYSWLKIRTRNFWNGLCETNSSYMNAFIDTYIFTVIHMYTNTHTHTHTHAHSKRGRDSVTQHVSCRLSVCCNEGRC